MSNEQPSEYQEQVLWFWWLRCWWGWLAALTVGLVSAHMIKGFLTPNDNGLYIYPASVFLGLPYIMIGRLLIMVEYLKRELAEIIGIGRSFTAPILPQHRASGSALGVSSRVVKRNP